MIETIFFLKTYILKALMEKEDSLLNVTFWNPAHMLQITIYVYIVLCRYVVYHQFWLKQEKKPVTFI